MSGPHGGGQPPAILLEWSSAAGAWCATAVVPIDLEPFELEGPTSSFGSCPSAALGELLGRRFGVLADGDCSPTVISIDREAR